MRKTQTKIYSKSNALAFAGWRLGVAELVALDLELLARVLGVAEEHLGVLVEKDGVFDVGIPGGERPGTQQVVTVSPRATSA